MLDKTDFIARYDKDDFLGQLRRQPQQLNHKYAEPRGLKDLGDIGEIVCAGMGGTALAAELVRNWLGDRLPVPLTIVRDYDLPGHVGKRTLVVCSSYSGKTEETLSALEQARERGAKVAVIAAGGKLLAAAREHGWPRFEMPQVPQGKLAVLYGVRAWAGLLEGLGMAQDTVKELEAMADWLAGEAAVWGPEKATDGNEAKQVASELVGHPVVLYAGPALASAAMRWKAAINENGKNLAFWNVYPEQNHNELAGWAHPAGSGLKVVELRSKFDHERVAQRFEVTNRLVSNVFAPVEVQAEGKTKLEQLVWTGLLGDYVSAYLGVLNQVNPMTSEMAEKLKRELG